MPPDRRAVRQRARESGEGEPDRRRQGGSRWLMCQSDGNQPVLWTPQLFFACIFRCRSPPLLPSGSRSVVRRALPHLASFPFTATVSRGSGRCGRSSHSLRRGRPGAGRRPIGIQISWCILDSGTYVFTQTNSLFAGQWRCLHRSHYRPGQTALFCQRHSPRPARPDNCHARRIPRRF